MARNNFSFLYRFFILARPYSTNVIAAATVLSIASMASILTNKFIFFLISCNHFSAAIAALYRGDRPVQ